MRYLHEYKRHFPDSWEDLSERQQIQAVRLLMDRPKNRCRLRVKLALVLMGYNSWWKRIKAFWTVDDIMLYDLAVNPKGYRIHRFLMEYLPFIQIGGQRYYAPRQDIKDLVFYEYMIITQQAQAFNQLRESDFQTAYQHALKVVAAIYREPSAKSSLFDKRQPLKTKEDDIRLESRIKAFSKLNPFLIMRLFDWIVGKCQVFPERYKYLFSDDSRLEKFKSENLYGLADMVITGAEAWRISTEDFGQRPVDEVLMEMSIKKRRSAEQIEQLEKPTQS